MRVALVFLLVVAVCIVDVAVGRKRPRKLRKSDYSATKKNFAPSCPLKKKKAGRAGARQRALVGVDFAQLPQDFFAERVKAGETATSFWKTSTDKNTLLTYDGPMCHNQIDMTKLHTALEHLNAEVVDHDEVVKYFNYVRDWRGLPNGTHSDKQSSEWDDDDNESQSANDRGAANRRKQFVRRMTWLYPMDSCFLRAELVARLAEDVMTVKPRTLHKIYVFGDLKVNTKYSSDGYVEWVYKGYHVAVLVKDHELGFIVMDAALHPEGPLPLDEWLGMMRPPGCHECYKSGFALTNRFVFSPADNCDEIVSVFDEWQGINDPEAFLYYSNMLKEYLDDEWNNIVSLGKNPAELLAKY